MEAIHSQEMEQMRNEMNCLKSMLEDQKIVNKKIMRRAMNKSYKKEKSNIVSSIIMAAAAIPLFLILLPKIGIPLWFSIITIIFFLAAIGASAYSLRKYASEDLITGDLLTVAGKITKYKCFCNNWLKVSLPFLLLWLMGFFHFLFDNADTDFSRGTIVGGIIGLIVGSILGIINLHQSRKRLNEILKQIDELKEEQ